jgi:phenylacetate-coenzyme A ligase PaaK-like adenylate-forming protein
MPSVSEIVGRIDDILTLSDGRQLSSFNRFFADIQGLVEVQVEQMDYDHLVLHMVVTEKFSDQVREEVLQAIYARLGRVRVDFDILDHIPRNASGKFKAVVSHVNPEEKPQ